MRTYAQHILNTRTPQTDVNYNSVVGKRYESTKISSKYKPYSPDYNRRKQSFYRLETRYAYNIHLNPLRRRIKRTLTTILHDY